VARLKAVGCEVIRKEKPAERRGLAAMNWQRSSTSSGRAMNWWW
jgi:hypothetical protein